MLQMLDFCISKKYIISKDIENKWTKYRAFAYELKPITINHIGQAHFARPGVI